jgi:ABC-type multidrug transport system fused ATPase/permease subunit
VAHAVAGASGSGKSTLLRLLTRLFDPVHGSILIDGRDLRSLTLASLRQAVAVVTQSPVLFTGSIADNIRLGRPEAADDDVLAAAEAANLHRDVSDARRFPRGYDTDVGERGRRLSDGQKQRLAIARAFLHNAPVPIIDEATASQDAAGERLIQDSITRLMSGKTYLVVAHRLTTLTTMDRILVMSHGRIEQDGPHSELMSRPGLYQSLWREFVRSDGRPDGDASRPPEPTSAAR